MNAHDPTSSHHGLAVPVDRRRAEELRARLHEELVGRTAHTERSRTADRQELTVHTHPPEPRARRVIAVAAAGVAAAGLVGLAVVASRDDAETATRSVAGSQPATTTATTTAATTITTTTTTTTTTTATTTAPPTTGVPLTDEEIAAAILPAPDAFAERWREGPPWTLSMDGSIAASQPSCAPFTAAFESPERPAAVAGAYYLHDEEDALSSVYSVVFPTDQAAIAMFDATADPAFMQDCHDDYDRALAAAGATSLSPYVSSLGGDFVDHEVVGHADLDVTADQQWQVTLVYAGTGEDFRLSTTRVGRTVVVAMGVIESVGGYDRLSEDQFRSVVAGTVQRARELVGGAAPAATPPTTGVPLTDEAIAAAALPRRDDGRLPEYGDGWSSASTIQHVEMRGDIAAGVSECEPFLAAFESPDRPATVAVELAWHVDPPSALSSTYAVVFADEAAARAMFDATRDPGFVRDCSPAYDQALYEATGQSISEPGFSYFPYFNDRAVPSITDGETYTDLTPPDFGADEQWAIQLNYTTDTMQVTTVRVGRVVVVVQSTKSSNVLTVDDTGRAVARPSVVQTEEQYHAIIRAVVERTHDALAGVAPAQAG